MPAELRPTSYWRGAVHFETGKVSPWTGLRNAAGVGLALAAGTFFGNTASGMVLAIGALNSGYSDGQDCYRQRARRMSATAVPCGSAVCAEDLPDLRESHNALIRGGDSAAERHALVNIEADRITNSLNTLAEGILERLPLNS